MNQFLNGTPDNRASPAQAPKGGWPKSFNLPAPPPGPTPEQQAAMEQFQQLLQPHSPSGDAAKASSLGSPIFSPSSVAPNSAPGPPAAIPIGASYAPLSSGIAMPAGVARLPGLLGPTNTAAAGVGAGMETAAAAVDVVRAAAGRDSAAQILMRGSKQEDLFKG